MSPTPIHVGGRPRSSSRRAAAAYRGTSLAGAELLEAAIPKSLEHLLVSSWANLLLLFGTLLIALTLLLPGDSLYRPELRLGVLLAAIGGAGLFVRSLLWRLVAPPAPAGARSGVVAASRRFGMAALILGLLLIAGCQPASLADRSPSAKSPRSLVMSTPDCSSTTAQPAHDPLTRRRDTRSVLH